MKRTITTLNRFTISTRSWQAKAACLLFSVILLTFLSCKDDADSIGFSKGVRLDAFYVDIPLNPKVVQIEGVLSRNTSSDIVTRIMVGKYNDPQFGNTEARAYANFAPPDQSLDPSSTATVDSLVLQLKLDYYYYGGTDVSLNTLQIYEVLDTIQSTAGYYTTSNPRIGTQPIGQASFYVDPSGFDQSIVNNADTDTTNNTTLNLRFKISGNLGASLLSDLALEPDIIENFDQFCGKYKGFAIVMSEGDKIVGIDPRFTVPFVATKDTKLSLYYTDNGVQTRADFVLYYQSNNTLGVTNPVTSFTSISTDFSSTPLNGLEPFTQFVPPDGKFPVQSGTGLMTRFDLTQFYKHIDTLKNIVFNSAELVVNNGSILRPPAKVQLRILDSLNHFRSPELRDTLVNGLTTYLIDPYFVAMQKGISYPPLGSSYYMDVIGDQGVSVNVDPDTKIIGGIFVSEFCQQIYRYKDDPRRITNFALMTEATEFPKSLGSLVLDKSVSLRLYYSVPITKIR